MCSFFGLFHQHLCNIYLLKNLVEHLSFCSHVVVVEEPLAVTNILVIKLKPRPAGTCRVIEQHYLRHNKNKNTNQLSDLKTQIKYWL
jgi:hypothetical protein